MHENQRISPQTDVLNILSSFLLTAVSSVREWDSAEGDIWACAEYINGNIAKYHQSTKGLSEDFMNLPVKYVHCVKRITADCSLMDLQARQQILRDTKAKWCWNVTSSVLLFTKQPVE